jgi:hypothetical protein
MKLISKAIAVAGVSSIALMSGGAAYAACTPSVDLSSGSIVVDATGCSGVQVTNAPATLSTPGLLQLDGAGNVTSDGGVLQNTVTVQGGQIAGLQGDVSGLQTTVSTHTGQISDLQNRATTDEADIAANTTAIHQTNTRLNSFNGTGGTVEDWASGVDSTLTNYGNRITTAEGKITNLYSLYGAQQGQINNLNGRMDKAYAGIAMATAFESPQVDPGKRFGISLNWGEFEGVSAFSTSAKLRFNDNWAATGGAAVSQSGQTAAKIGIQTQW